MPFLSGRGWDFNHKLEANEQSTYRVTKYNGKHELLPLRSPSTVATIRDAPLPDGPRSLIQDCNGGLKPFLKRREKIPHSFQRVRHHQPGQILLTAWMADSNAGILLPPFEHRRRHGPVTSRRDDRFHDLILRVGGEIEEALKVYRFPVFAEYEGCIRIWNLDLARV